MIQSIYAGVSSLQSFQTGIDVLANNIANVNTVGFKGSTTEFSNLYEKAVNTSGNAITSMQSGLGVQVNTTALDLSLGSYYQSDNITDLAIAGDDGWFGLSGPNNQEFFTRAGNFRFDPYSADGIQTDTRLINPDGFFVTGTLANNTTNSILSPVVDSLDLGSVASQEALVFPSELTFPVIPSTQADFFGNIGTENIAQVVSAEVISPQSERNNLRLVFTQSTVQPASGINWDVVATTQTADGSTIYDTQTGLVSFDGSGALISSTLGALNNNGATVTPNLGTEFSGLISNSGPTVASSATVDGTLAGELINYSVNRNGDVISTFTNGAQSVVGKVAIYHFQNDQGLEAVSGNKFRVSDNSGQPIFYTENNGQLLAGTLENSNVRLDTALTELIIMQRSYDAASKTITTGDEMLKNALQM
jgi:flagellar hook protein FlgE